MYININQTKDIILATVTHDLKTPLNAVITYIRLLKQDDGIKQLPAPQINEYLQIAENNSILL